MADTGITIYNQNGQVPFSILKQSYRNDPVSEGLLLQSFKKTEIPFKTITADGKETITEGTIIRSGYRQSRDQSPIIKVDGNLQFSLPGQPIFPPWATTTFFDPPFPGQLGLRLPLTSTPNFPTSPAVSIG